MPSEAIPFLVGSATYFVSTGIMWFLVFWFSRREK